jgi:hypothetical protein
MALPDDDEMHRIFQVVGKRDPQLIRDIILDPSQPLTLDNVQLHEMREITQVWGFVRGEDRRTLIPEAREWVSEHGIDETPGLP